MFKLNFDTNKTKLLADVIQKEGIRLSELVFYRCKIKTEAMKTILAAVNARANADSVVSQIEKITFEQIFIQEKTATVIGDMLVYNQNIKTLNIYGAGLGDLAVAEI